MYRALFTKSFKTKYKKYTKKDDLLKKRINKTLMTMETDPKAPSLKSHMVNSSRHGKRWSSRVTGDLRIIWDFNKDKINILDILDLGGHSGKNKVYR